MLCVCCVKSGRCWALWVWEWPARLGGMNARNLFAMGQRRALVRPRQSSVQPQQSAPSAGSWTCACKTVNTGKFCTNCASTKPEDGWTCSCGAVNKGKFCAECGKPKPAGEPLYKCDKCGWEPGRSRIPLNSVQTAESF